METKEEILKKHFDKKGITNEHIHVAAYLSVIDAMDEYAENKVKNLTLPHVINNEAMKCSCGNASKIPVCFECFMKEMDRQSEVSVGLEHKSAEFRIKHL